MIQPMADQSKSKDFTVFLEGHEGHQGNVLGHAYITKISKLLNVLAKMERAYLAAGQRRTDFEIVGAEKYNPTTITLKPVPRTKNYNPSPAFHWSLDQMEAIGQGREPDERVGSQLARDLADMAKGSNDSSYKSFWINGHADKINFDDAYHINALKLAKQLATQENPVVWFSGKAEGEVVGRLEKIDNYDADHEFVLVPPVGAEKIVCKFPVSMEPEVGKFVFKMVRVSGDLFYSEDSPHPYKVNIREGGITSVKSVNEKRTLRDLRGIFKGHKPKQFNLEKAL